MRFILALVAILIATCFGVCNAQSMEETAQRAYRTRILRHAPNVTEVMCIGCNQQTAWIIWQKSPPHRALLPRIRRVYCYGDVCVGR